MSDLTTGQVIVLGQCFSEWPEDMSFKDILENIRNGEEYDCGISRWEPYDDWCSDEFADHMLSLSKRIDELIKQEIKGARL